MLLQLVTLSTRPLKPAHNARFKQSPRSIHWTCEQNIFWFRHSSAWKILIIARRLIWEASTTYFAFSAFVSLFGIHCSVYSSRQYSKIVIIGSAKELEYLEEGVLVIRAIIIIIGDISHGRSASLRGTWAGDTELIISFGPELRAGADLSCLSVGLLSRAAGASVGLRSPITGSVPGISTSDQTLIDNRGPVRTEFSEQPEFIISIDPRTTPSTELIPFLIITEYAPIGENVYLPN